MPFSAFSGLADDSVAPETGPATAYLQPYYTIFFDQDFLLVDLMVNPGGRPANVLSSTINFPPGQLAVKSWEYNESFSWLALFENLDQAKGSLELTGGLPGGSIATTTKIARIRFEKLSDGWAEINFTNIRLFAADGFGTAIPVLPEIHRVYLYK